MKRNVNLIELSRDHHFGLLLGWKIKQGLAKGVEPERIARYCIHFAEKALFPHFRQEEEQLLPFLPDLDEMRLQTLEEHEAIRNAMRTISDREGLQHLASLVESHIRFEERQLFPYMESTLSSEDLGDLGELLRAVHEPYLENYSDEFWAN